MSENDCNDCSFLLAGLAEIGGGYLVWLWLREAKPVSYGIAGSLILVAYGVIPTFQQFPTFGRVMRPMAVFLSFSLCFGAGGSIAKP